MVVIIMGVSGSGKTTVGEALSMHLDIPFYDADDFHPPSNVDKMASGNPLNDEDRQPWLETLHKEISNWEQGDGAILACSALKENYRETLIGNQTVDIRWVFLKVDRQTLLNRLNQRQGHYFPPELLDSQLKTLEDPHNAILVDGNESVDNVVKKLIHQLSIKEQN